MAYTIIDKNALKIQLAPRPKALEILSALQENNPDGDFVMVHEVNEDITSDALEELYALASMLLQESGINPFHLNLTITEMDGTKKEISAVNIMNNAREFMDGIDSEYH